VNAPSPPVREKLGDDGSAVIRAQLIQEIETVPEDELRSRATAILKAKNRLSANDAKLVEESFAARMTQQDESPEALTTDEPKSPPSDSTPPQPASRSIVVAKPVRARGRPRKVKAAPEQSAAPPVPPKPAIDNSPPATHLQADATPAKIEKNELTISEPRRHRDKSHLKFVASQPCLVCGRSPADAHHLRFTQPRAMGRKVSDEFTVPLCRTHHRDNHRFGDEQAWWGRQAIDPVGTSRQLWVSTRRIEWGWHRLCRKIFDRRKILIERLERCKNGQERSGRRRLDNEPLSFFSDNCVLSRQLEFARNSNSLIPPILEKFNVPFTHRYRPRAACGFI
jgi:hypothetical protein